MDNQSEPGRRHRSGETRRLLLEAGVDLVRERATQTGDEVVGGALAHVRLTQVATRATALRRARGDPHAPAVTTGAIYNLWSSQVDYQADLLLHIAGIQANLAVDAAKADAAYRAAAAAGKPLDDVLRDLALRVRKRYAEDALFAVALGFAASAADPRVQRALRFRQDAFLAATELAWQSLLDAYHLQLRPPYTRRHLAIAISSQFQGSVSMGYGNPDMDADPAGAGGPSSLAAHAITAIFHAMTMPAAAADRDS